MKLSELKPEQIYVGMRIVTAIGNLGTIRKYQKVHDKDIIINECVNISDDDDVWFDVDGDDGRGHGVYLHHADQITVV